MRKDLAAAGLALISAACGPSCGFHAEDNASRDVTVLRGVLADHCSNALSGYWVLTADAARPEPLPLGPGLDSRQRQAAGNMFRRNRLPHFLPPGLECPTLRLASKQVVDAAFHRTGPPLSSPGEEWDAFYRTFPGALGIISVSLPGYSLTGDVACVYANQHRGPHGGKGWFFGEGWFVYLKKVRGRWIAFYRWTAWIS